MATRIQSRRGTASAWTAANPVLAAGEIGVETDTRKFKFGDGVTAWNTLAYAAGSTSTGNPVTTIASATGTQTLTVSAATPEQSWKITRTGNVTIALAGAVAGVTCSWLLEIHTDGSHTVAWPSNISWVSQTLPTLSTVSTTYDLVQLVTMDGGTTFSGVAVTGLTPAAAPSAPTSVTVTPGDTQNVVAWTQGAANGSAVTNNEIWRATSSGAETLLTTIAANTTYTDTGLTNGTTYYYKIKAINGIGTSAFSAEASGTPVSALALNDQFTGTNGTNLTAHTADTGESWTAYAGTVTIQGNKAQMTYSAGASHRYDITPGGSLLGKTVESTVTHSSGRVKFHLAVLSAGAGDRLELWMDATGGTPSIKLYKQVAGSGTVLATAGSGSVTLGATVTYQIVIPASLTNPILVKQNGSTVISYTLTSGEQTAFGSNTKVGLGGYTDVGGATGGDGGDLFDYLTVG